MNVLIIGPYPPLKGGISDFNHQLYLHLEEFKNCYFISFDRNYPFFLRNKKKQVSSQKKENKNVIRINPYNPFTWWKIKRLIKEKEINYVITTYWTPITGLAYLLINKSYTLNTKKIGLFHNVFPHENYLFSKIILRLYINSLDTLITLSEQTAKQIKSFSKRESQTLFHPIDDLKMASKEESLRKLKLNKNNKYILFLGMIRKYKGLELLLKSFKNIIDFDNKIKLIIAGEFIENKKKYINLIDKLSLKNHVIFSNGFIRKRDIKYYMGASEIIVQPYITATQSGITALSISFEKINVTTGEGGIKEMINNENGYICHKDYESISKNIIKALTSNNSKKLKNLSTLKKKFSWNNFCKELLKKI